MFLCLRLKDTNYKFCLKIAESERKINPGFSTFEFFETTNFYCRQIDDKMRNKLNFAI